MINWVQQFIYSDRQTKIFVLMGIIYGAAIVISTAYVYARLDFVRNKPIPMPVETNQSKKYETSS